MELCVWQRAKYINNVCKAFVALCHHNYVILILTRSSGRKDQVLTYVYYLTKLSIKYLFIYCGK